tara:strand:+ start:70 stop:438 length:369 start_codon:yes stop_codon:yes gene_type:complete
MREWIIIGAIFAALSVLIGAFGAHGLKGKISTEDLVIFEVGVRYQMYHALALILLGLIGYSIPGKILILPGILFCLGIFIFSGSLYLMVLTSIRWLGAITPIGGVFLILGWFSLVLKMYKNY